MTNCTHKIQPILNFTVKIVISTEISLFRIFTIASSFFRCIISCCVSEALILVICILLCSCLCNIRSNVSEALMLALCTLSCFYLYIHCSQVSEALMLTIRSLSCSFLNDASCCDSRALTCFTAIILSLHAFFLDGKA